MTESEVSTATTSPEGENLTNRASWCSSVTSLVESTTFQTLQGSEFNQEGKAVIPNSPVPTGSDERIAEQIDRGNVKLVSTQHVQQTAILQTPHENLKLAIFSSWYAKLIYLCKFLRQLVSRKTWINRMKTHIVSYFHFLFLFCLYLCITLYNSKLVNSFQTYIVDFLSSSDNQVTRLVNDQTAELSWFRTDQSAEITVSENSIAKDIVGLI